MGAIWDLELTAPQRLVMLAMADHAEHDGTSIFPSIGKIAWKTGYSEKQTRRIINGLVKLELLSRERRDGYTNMYAIHIEKGVKKLPYDGSKRDPSQNVTPPTAMTGDPSHSYVPPTPPIAMSPESSFQPSLNHSGADEQRKAKTTPAKQMNPMKDAIVSAFGWKWESMSGREKGIVQKAAKELCEVGLEPDDIPSLYAYCKRQFTNFKPLALSGNVSEWRKSRPSKIIRDDGYIPIEERTSVLDGLVLA